MLTTYQSYFLVVTVFGAVLTVFGAALAGTAFLTGALWVTFLATT
jgi:hypothetical protein